MKNRLIYKEKKGAMIEVGKMSEEKIEFKRLDAKLVGSDTVVFRLEDGATVKIKVDIERAGVAVNFKNPNGSPHYEVGCGLKINVIPTTKTYSIPKSKLHIPPSPPQKPAIKPV